VIAVRRPAVAGLFYPADAAELRREVEDLLGGARGPEGAAPKALIVPHAGYVYSGPVAATGYARLRGAAVRRVVLLGPAHRYPLRGVATHGADFFETPLGRIPVERTSLPVLDAAHAKEHSLEVHLPFLQVVLGEFTLVPVVVGDASPDEVADALEGRWGGPETLVVVSSDLSHYHDYATARRLDRRTADAITAAEPGLRPEQACGCHAVNGLLALARKKGLAVELLDLRSSGDTAGPRDEVVGYGAFAVHA
jgi:AmmeMemoRadiSam system protein B